MRSLQVPYGVATRVDGRVNAEWPGLAVEKASGSARMSMTPTASAASRSTLPMGGRIDVSGDGTRVDATLTSVRVAGADINGRVRLGDRQQLDGTLHLSAANVQSTIAAVEAFLGRPHGSLVPVTLAGSVVADGRDMADNCARQRSMRRCWRRHWRPVGRTASA